MSTNHTFNRFKATGYTSRPRPRYGRLGGLSAEPIAYRRVLVNPPFTRVEYKKPTMLDYLDERTGLMKRVFSRIRRTFSIRANWASIPSEK